VREVAEGLLVEEKEESVVMANALGTRLQMMAKAKGLAQSGCACAFVPGLAGRRCAMHQYSMAWYASSVGKTGWDSSLVLSSSPLLCWLVLSFMHSIRLCCAVDNIHGLTLVNAPERSTDKSSFPSIEMIYRKHYHAAAPPCGSGLRVPG
jgi:hypothetical protein